MRSEQKNAVPSETYAQTSYDMFMEYILPTLDSIPTPYESIHRMVTDYSKNALSPGKRFYPSSLALVTAKSLNPNLPLTPKVTFPATAIELFHNYTLIHDDVIDRHTLRRNETTLYGQYGSGSALLAGNYAVGAALWLLKDGHAADFVTQFAHAISTVNHGQLMDERPVWDTIPQDKLLSHWKDVARFKTITGGLACAIGSIIAGRLDLVEKWYRFEENLGVMSQVINDVGDVWRFTGYIDTESSRRTENEETDIKYTYPRIWFLIQTGKDLRDFPNPRKALLEVGFETHAREYVEQLRTEAIRTLEKLNLPESKYKAVLFNFVMSPKLPALNHE